MVLNGQDGQVRAMFLDSRVSRIDENQNAIVHFKEEKFAAVGFCSPYLNTHVTGPAIEALRRENAALKIEIDRIKTEQIEGLEEKKQQFGWDEFYQKQLQLTEAKKK